MPAGTHGQGSQRGVDGEVVTFVEHGDLAAAVSRVALDRPPGRRAELRAHGAVVDALAATGPVVPTQFGAIVADDRLSSRSCLAAAHARSSGRSSLHGTCEMRMRATYVEERVLAEVVRGRPEHRGPEATHPALPQGSVHPERVGLGELVSRAMEDKRAGDSEAVMAVVARHPVGGAAARGRHRPPARRRAAGRG